MQQQASKTPNSHIRSAVESTSEQARSLAPNAVPCGLPSRKCMCASDNRHPQPPACPPSPHTQTCADTPDNSMLPGAATAGAAPIANSMLSLWLPPRTRSAHRHALRPVLLVPQVPHTAHHCTWLAHPPPTHRCQPSPAALMPWVCAREACSTLYTAVVLLRPPH